MLSKKNPIIIAGGKPRTPMAADSPVPKEDFFSWAFLEKMSNGTVQLSVILRKPFEGDIALLLQPTTDGKIGIHILRGEQHISFLKERKKTKPVLYKRIP